MTLYHPARLTICSVFACCCIGLAFPALAQEPRAEKTEESDVAEKMAEPPKSQEELATRLLKLLEEENFEGVRRLMLPPELPVELGLVKSEEQQRDHERYVQSVKDTPELAKRYKAFLEEKGVLSLNGLRVQAKPPRKSVLPNGRTITGSNGVLLVDEKGTPKGELIDQTAGIDGNWYILNLATENTVREMEQKQQKDP